MNAHKAFAWHRAQEMVAICTRSFSCVNKDDDDGDRASMRPPML